MIHQDWEDLIPFYLAQKLPQEQARALERHLTGCSACQHSLEEWRVIATAVWAEANTAAQRPPALSAGFYERLAPRDPALAGMPAAAQRTPTGAARRARTPQSGIPITIAAGVLLVTIFGALLVLGAFSRPDDPEGQMIALKGTDSSTPSEIFGAWVEQPSATPTELIGGGILPTPTINSGSQSVPFGGGNGGGSPQFLPSAQPPATIDPAGSSLSMIVEPSPEPVITEEAAMSSFSMIAPEGPFITLTPGLIESGTHLCKLFNPTADLIPVYEAASLDSALIAGIVPGAEYRTLVRSVEGWYMIFVDRMGWVNPQQAYLRGNCEASVFWVPTPTQTPTPTAETPPDTSAGQ